MSEGLFSAPAAKGECCHAAEPGPQQPGPLPSPRPLLPPGAMGKGRSEGLAIASPRGGLIPACLRSKWGVTQISDPPWTIRVSIILPLRPGGFEKLDRERLAEP